MERVKDMAAYGGQWLLRAVLEPGAVESPAIGISGLMVSLAAAKEWAQLIVAAGTALIVMIHLFYHLVRIGCPLRRNQVKDCSACRLVGSALCPRKLNKEDL